MREIKFRAWMNDKMLDDVVLVWDYPKEHDMGAPLNAGIQNFIKFGEGKHILMQYTGRKDSNNKEAYHKDKVSALGYDNWVIEWHGNGWKLKQEGVENYQDIPKDFIVFGNVYEEKTKKL